MVVTEEGLPLSYEVFEGNRADVTTLEEILDSVERKHGRLGRVWVFDRGLVSEENLSLLRSQGASYLVATPKRLLTQFQKDLIAEAPSKASPIMIVVESVDFPVRALGIPPLCRGASGVLRDCGWRRTLLERVHD